MIQNSHFPHIFSETFILPSRSRVMIVNRSRRVFHFTMGTSSKGNTSMKRNTIVEKLTRLLSGRYGADNLYNALFAVELILLFLGAVFSLFGKLVPALRIVSIILYALSLILLIIAMYRFFSRDISRRRKENEAWLRFWNKLRRKNRPSLPADTPTHVFRQCPGCRSVLRLPRQKGKHQVRCPRCGEKFGVKVK